MVNKALEEAREKRKAKAFVKGERLRRHLRWLKEKERARAMNPWI